MEHWQELYLSADEGEEIRHWLETGEGKNPRLSAKFDDECRIIIHFDLDGDEYSSMPFHATFVRGDNHETGARLYPYEGGDFATDWIFEDIYYDDTYSISVVIEGEGESECGGYSTYECEPVMAQSESVWHRGSTTYPVYCYD